MKLFGVEIPLDGLAVSVATFMLSPDQTRIRNTIIIAGIHGVLHPIEVSNHISEEKDVAISHSVIKGLDHDNALVHFNDRRFNFKGKNAPIIGVHTKIHNMHDTFGHDVAFFKHVNMKKN